MYAMEIVNFPDPSGRQREEVILHEEPFDERAGPRHLTEIWSSKAYFCPHCAKVWATRIVMVDGKALDFSVLSDFCPKCGPPSFSGIRGGCGALFTWPKELELYLPRLPLTLKINEFLALLQEHEHEEDRR